MNFYQRMQEVCARIPYGRAATYGQIALLCGLPSHARQVGYALSHLPFIAIQRYNRPRLLRAADRAGKEEIGHAFAGLVQQ